MAASGENEALRSSDWRAFFELLSSVSRRWRLRSPPDDFRRPGACSPLLHCHAVCCSQERGIKLRLNLPDTLILQQGQPLAWFATNKVQCGLRCEFVLEFVLALLAMPCRSRLMLPART